MPCQQRTAAAVGAALLMVAWVCAAQAQTASPGPGESRREAAVFFPQKAFQFEPVIEGVKVVHNFVVMNRGTVPLLINSVRTG